MRFPLSALAVIGLPALSLIQDTIDRESTTLHAMAILGNGAGDAPFRIGEGRFMIKPDSGISAVRLSVGENVLQFHLRGTVWHQGVLYDSIRMEVVSPPEPAS